MFCVVGMAVVEGPRRYSQTPPWHAAGTVFRGKGGGGKAGLKVVGLLRTGRRAGVEAPGLYARGGLG